MMEKTRFATAPVSSSDCGKATSSVSFGFVQRDRVRTGGLIAIVARSARALTVSTVIKSVVFGIGDQLAEDIQPLRNIVHAVEIALRISLSDLVLRHSDR
jgi:hypothetical protein